MSLIKCPECGKETDNTTAECSNCGYPIQDKELKGYCPNCGEKLDDSDMFCPKCGYGINSGESEEKRENDEKDSALAQLDQLNDSKNLNQNLNMRKKLLIAGCVVVGLVFIGIFAYFTSDHYKYNCAQKEYQKENYAKATEIFKELGNYKDSMEMHESAKHKNAVKNDSTPPTISMESDSVTLKQGEEFDVYDWIETNKVVVEDDVTEDVKYSVETTGLDTNAFGEYKIIVCAEDEAGNEQSKEVPVIVERVYTQAEIEKAVKATFTKDIPGLDRIEYEEPVVWIYIVQDGLAEAAVGAKVNSSLKAAWDEMTDTLDNTCKQIYQHLQLSGYDDIASANIMLLNNLDKSKMLYVTVNGIKFADVTD